MATSEMNIDAYTVGQHAIGNFGSKAQKREEDDNGQYFDCAS